MGRAKTTCDHCTHPRKSFCLQQVVVDKADHLDVEQEPSHLVGHSDVEYHHQSTHNCKRHNYRRKKIPEELVCVIARQLKIGSLNSPMAAIKKE